MTYLFGLVTVKHEFVDPLFWLTQHIGKIIDERKQNNVSLFRFFFLILRFRFFLYHRVFLKINKKDFIQLLTEAQIDDKDDLKKKEKIELSKFRLDRQMSSEVKLLYEVLK